MRSKNLDDTEKKKSFISGTQINLDFFAYRVADVPDAVPGAMLCAVGGFLLFG